ncbi:MAG: 50S ribosomal protein L11 methyltransferase [Burkholderiales bacterium]
MPWQSLIIEVNAAIADRLSDALLEAGGHSASIEDANEGTSAEEPLFGEPGGPAGVVWKASRIRALLDESADAAGLLAAACHACELTTLPSWRTEAIPDEDWVERVRAQFEPIRISERLWIVPSWREPVDTNAINLVLDPGLAFGTGSHPTTQLCLRWLEEVVHGGESVIDYGCGSGILALAAAKFGAGRIVGVDIDPTAVASARANAAENRVSAEFQTSDRPLVAPADIVVANILANPLKVLAPALARLVVPGGRLALAGLLAEQADELVGVYRPYFDLQPYATQDGWTCLAGERRIGG